MSSYAVFHCFVNGCARDQVNSEGRSSLANVSGWGNTEVRIRATPEARPTRDVKTFWPILCWKIGLSIESVDLDWRFLGRFTQDFGKRR